MACTQFFCSPDRMRTDLLRRENGFVFVFVFLFSSGVARAAPRDEGDSQMKGDEWVLGAVGRDGEAGEKGV